MRRRRNRLWRPRRGVAAWRLKAWWFSFGRSGLESGRLVRSGPNGRENSLAGGRNCNRPYGSRDAQGKSVSRLTVFLEITAWDALKTAAFPVQTKGFRELPNRKFLVRRSDFECFCVALAVSKKGGRAGMTRSCAHP